MTSPPSSCPFCRIARRQTQAQIVYEDEFLVAFLDARASRLGHVQIIPRDHYPTFDDLTAELASRLIILGQRLARILRASLKASSATFLIAGSDIEHAHARVMPLDAPSATEPDWPSEDELRRVAFTLRQALNAKDAYP